MFNLEDKVKYKTPKMKRLGVGIVKSFSDSGKSIGVIWPDGPNHHCRTNPSWTRPASIERIEVSKAQLEEMKHALGLNRNAKKTRNYFYTSSDDANWNDLVLKLLATKKDGWDSKSVYYQLTEAGERMVYESLGRTQHVGAAE